MDMKKIILMFIILSSAVFSMYVSVDVSGNIRGDTTYSNYTKTTSKLISIKFNLENIGSVTCKTYYRVNFEKSNKTIYVAWSNERVSKPGDSSVFNIFWVPNENGTIIAQPYLYMCDNVYNLNPFEINVTSTPNATEMVAESKNTESSVDITFMPDENGTYLIVPESYPQGWKFSSVSMQALAGEMAKVHINFDTPFFIESNVRFYVVSPKNLSYIDVQLSKPKWYEKINYYEVGFYILLALIAIMLIVLLHLNGIKNKRRRHK